MRKRERERPDKRENLKKTKRSRVEKWKKIYKDILDMKETKQSMRKRKREIK